MLLLRFRSLTWFFLRARSRGVSFFLSLAFTFALACIHTRVAVKPKARREDATVR